MSLTNFSSCYPSSVATNKRLWEITNRWLSWWWTDFERQGVLAVTFLDWVAKDWQLYLAYLSICWYWMDVAPQPRHYVSPCSCQNHWLIICHFYQQILLRERFHPQVECVSDDCASFWCQFSTCPPRKVDLWSFASTECPSRTKVWLPWTFWQTQASFWLKVSTWQSWIEAFLS